MKTIISVICQVTKFNTITSVGDSFETRLAVFPTTVEEAKDFCRREYYAHIKKAETGVLHHDGFLCSKNRALREVVYTDGETLTRYNYYWKNDTIG